MTLPQDLKPEAASLTSAAPKTTRPKHRAPIPEALADVALIDATTSAAAGGMGVSWWHAEVAAGRAPAPVIREPRCTRWRLADVRAFWLARAEQGAKDTQAGAAVILKATRASHKARSMRRAAAAQAGA